MSPKKSKAEKKVEKKESGGGGAMLLSVALGAALAAGAGYYATHKEEVDREAAKRIKQLAKAFHQTRAQVEKRVVQIWGDVSEDAVATYMDVRGSLLHALEEENVTKTGKFLQSNYNKLVDAAVKAAKASGVVEANVSAKLAKSLKTDWEEVKENYLPYAHQVAAAARTGLKKAAAKKPAVKKTVKKAVRKVAKKAAPKRKAVAKKKVVKKAAPKRKTAAKKRVTKKAAAKKRSTKKAVKKTARKPAKKKVAKKVTPKRKAASKKRVTKKKK